MANSSSNPGFTLGLNNSVFANALGRAGSSNTNRFAFGSSAVNSGKSSAVGQNLGATQNLSNTSNGLTGGSRSSTQNSMGGATGNSPGVSSQDRAQLFKGYISPFQWTGHSLRPPMSWRPNPARNDDPREKNIFFKFKDNDTPAISMWINPTQITINMSKRLPEHVTRGGFVIFHWGDNMDEIQANAITGSFWRPPCDESKNGAGYTQDNINDGIDRRDSFPYLRFMELLALYRNNGIKSIAIGKGAEGGGFTNPAQRPLASSRSTGTTFQRSTTSAELSGEAEQKLGRAERPIFVPIEMHYDDNVFTGYFSTFVWTERADDPFKFTFDFRFVVMSTEYNKVWEIDRIPEILSGPKETGSGGEKEASTLLANFQVPRSNSL